MPSSRAIRVDAVGPEVADRRTIRDDLETDDPARPPTAPEGVVRGHPDEPRPQRAFVADRPALLERGQERLDDDVLGVRPIPQDQVRDRLQLPAVGLEQIAERLRSMPSEGLDGHRSRSMVVPGRSVIRPARRIDAPTPLSVVHFRKVKFARCSLSRHRRSFCIGSRLAPSRSRCRRTSFRASGRSRWHHQRVTVFDLLLHGGIVVDGTGSPGRRADVGVLGDRILAIDDLSAVDAGGVTR